MTASRPATPSEALAELLAGNERFVTGTRIHPNQDAEHRTALASAQRPFAVVFGCSDSRLAAEIIFDRGLGDLFVVRTAGHIAGAEVLASISYGVTVLGAPLVVVLGHDSCGAVRATAEALDGDTPVPDHLTPIVERVALSVTLARNGGIDDLDEIAALHVRRTIGQLAAEGTAIGAAAARGECEVLGMTYRLADGRATVIRTAEA